jgi:hypothetical protein
VSWVVLHVEIQELIWYFRNFSRNLSTVLNPKKRHSDRQTEGRTDRQTNMASLLNIFILCKGRLVSQQVWWWGRGGVHAIYFALYTEMLVHSTGQVITGQFSSQNTVSTKFEIKNSHLWFLTPLLGRLHAPWQMLKLSATGLLFRSNKKMCSQNSQGGIQYPWQLGELTQLLSYYWSKHGFCSPVKTVRVRNVEKHFPDLGVYRAACDNLI